MNGGLQYSCLYEFWNKTKKAKSKASERRLHVQGTHLIKEYCSVRSNQKAVSKPYVYARYIDDIYVDIENADALQDLQRRLGSQPGLEFTIEYSVENRINFLDVSVDASGPNTKTDVYRKPTDAGKCLHGQSECPMRYKEISYTRLCTLGH